MCLYEYRNPKAVLMGVEARSGMQSGNSYLFMRLCWNICLGNFATSEIFSDGKRGNCWKLNKCFFPGSSHKGLW